MKKFILPVLIIAGIGIWPLYAFKNAAAHERAAGLTLDTALQILRYADSIHAVATGHLKEAVCINDKAAGISKNAIALMDAANDFLEAFRRWDEKALMRSNEKIRAASDSIGFYAKAQQKCRSIK